MAQQYQPSQSTNTQYLSVQSSLPGARPAPHGSLPPASTAPGPRPAPLGNIPPASTAPVPAGTYTPAPVGHSPPKYQAATQYGQAPAPTQNLQSGPRMNPSPTQRGVRPPQSQMQLSAPPPQARNRPPTQTPAGIPVPVPVPAPTHTAYDRLRTGRGQQPQSQFLKMRGGQQPHAPTPQELIPDSLIPYMPYIHFDCEETLLEVQRLINGYLGYLAYEWPTVYNGRNIDPYYSNKNLAVCTEQIDVYSISIPNFRVPEGWTFALKINGMVSFEKNNNLQEYIIDYLLGTERYLIQSYTSLFVQKIDPMARTEYRFLVHSTQQAYVEQIIRNKDPANAQAWQFSFKTSSLHASGEWKICICKWSKISPNGIPVAPPVPGIASFITEALRPTMAKTLLKNATVTDMGPDGPPSPIKTSIAFHPYRAPPIDDKLRSLWYFVKQRLDDPTTMENTAVYIHKSLAMDFNRQVLERKLYQDSGVRFLVTAIRDIKDKYKTFTVEPVEGQNRGPKSYRQILREVLGSHFSSTFLKPEEDEWCLTFTPVVVHLFYVQFAAFSALFAQMFPTHMLRDVSQTFPSQRTGHIPYVLMPRTGLDAKGVGMPTADMIAARLASEIPSGIDCTFEGISKGRIYTGLVLSFAQDNPEDPHIQEYLRQLAPNIVKNCREVVDTKGYLAAKDPKNSYQLFTVWPQWAPGQPAVPFQTFVQDVMSKLWPFISCVVANDIYAAPVTVRFAASLVKPEVFVERLKNYLMRYDIPGMDPINVAAPVQRYRITQTLPNSHNEPGWTIWPMAKEKVIRGLPLVALVKEYFTETCTELAVTREDVMGITFSPVLTAQFLLPKDEWGNIFPVLSGCQVKLPPDPNTGQSGYKTTFLNSELELTGMTFYEPAPWYGLKLTSPSHDAGSVAMRGIMQEIYTKMCFNGQYEKRLVKCTEPNLAGLLTTTPYIAFTPTSNQNGVSTLPATFKTSPLDAFERENNKRELERRRTGIPMPA